MMQTCRQCQMGFEITDEDLKFYERIGVTPPTLCPTDRQKQRIRFRNFRDLYTRPSSMSGENIISMYAPDSPYQVYSKEEWWGDNWDPTNYGREFNFNRPFFDQWHELNLAVPKVALLQYQNENCDYGNFVYKSRNCYLVFGCVNNEDCLYGHIVWQSFKCLDGLYVFRSQWSYECIDCVGCYQAFFSQECVNSSEIYFCFDCLNCRNCFGSTNLRNKEWYWFNEFVGEERYRKNLAEVLPLSRKSISTYQQKFAEIKLQAIHPGFFGNNNENISGDHVYLSKNTHHAFDAKECEDCKYIYTVGATKDSYDVSFSPGVAELLYGCLAVGSSAGCQRNIFCYDTLDSANVYYCDNCYSCQDCFGCSGLRHKQYCILNKQYTKEEYETLVPKIIESMKNSAEFSEFFPHEMSPFAYNESVVQEYYPLTKEQATGLGYRWKEKPEVHFDEPTAENIPEYIHDVPDDICQKVLVCEKTGRKYKIISQELEFYRRMGIPIPLRHPDQRHFDRMNLRNPRILYDRACNKCGAGIKTTYSPERPEKIYCEKCYLDEVY